jgi:hypothetical protein
VFAEQRGPGDALTSVVRTAHAINYILSGPGAAIKFIVNEMEMLSGIFG